MATAGFTWPVYRSDERAHRPGQKLQPGHQPGAVANALPRCPGAFILSRSTCLCHMSADSAVLFVFCHVTESGLIELSFMFRCVCSSIFLAFVGITFR